jgi:hypothetical protein
MNAKFIVFGYSRATTNIQQKQNIGRHGEDAPKGATWPSRKNRYLTGWPHPLAGGRHDGFQSLETNFMNTEPAL